MRSPFASLHLDLHLDLSIMYPKVPDFPMPRLALILAPYLVFEKERKK